MRQGVLPARVLIVAGSDSGGGAGIQGDIKTVSALGGYAMTAVTALTAQNSLGVHAVMPVPSAFVEAQVAACVDFGIDAVKTGMLGDAALIAAVARALAAHAPGVPVVVDPVMVAKGGHRLLADDAIGAVLALMVPGCALLTPNVPEAEALTGLRVTDAASMRAAAVALLARGAGAVLIKGGHLDTDAVCDVLVTAAGAEAFSAPRIASRHTHGTGCALASAVATGLAQGMALRDAVSRGRDFVRRAILAAPALGAGHGPLGHAAAGRR